MTSDLDLSREPQELLDTLDRDGRAHVIVPHVTDAGTRAELLLRASWAIREVGEMRPTMRMAARRGAEIARPECDLVFTIWDRDDD